MKLHLTMAFLAINFSLTSIAYAEKADRDKPISLSSDKVSFDDVNQIYLLETNVLLIKGTLIIRGESATIKVDPEGYQFATIIAKPGLLASLKQKRDTDFDEYTEGFAEKIDYDAKLERAILKGKARMNKLAGTKVSDQIHGDEIQYDSSDEKYHAISKNSVRSALSPRRKEPLGNTKK